MQNHYGLAFASASLCAAALLAALPWSSSPAFTAAAFAIAAAPPLLALRSIDLSIGRTESLKVLVVFVVSITIISLIR